MFKCPENLINFQSIFYFLLSIIQINSHPLNSVNISSSEWDKTSINQSENESNSTDLKQRFPDAIIIGVKKCGTRAMLEFLKINPNIKAPGPEVHFFDKNFDKGYDWYKRQMPFTTPGQLTIEKSPAYFVSKLVPQRVYAMNPHMKLILVVRNPIIRAISDYTQAVTRKKRSVLPTNSFEEMSRCNISEQNSTNVSTGKCTNGINSSWGAVKIGIYHKYLKNWLQYFKISQFLFVDGERLIRNPAEELQRAEKFLGLTPVVRTKDFVMDPIKGFPCVRRVDSKTPHCLGKSKGRQHPKVNSTLVRKLQDFYRPENEKFFRMINRYFHWY